MTKYRRKRVEVVETETHIVVLFGIAGGVMVLVQVPGGAVEGGICAFVMPSGATVQIVVPPGSGPGTILEVADPGAMLPTATVVASERGPKMDEPEPNATSAALSQLPEPPRSETELPTMGEPPRETKEEPASNATSAAPSQLPEPPRSETEPASDATSLAPPQLGETEMVTRLAERASSPSSVFEGVSRVSVTRCQIRTWRQILWELLVKFGYWCTIGFGGQALQFIPVVGPILSMIRSTIKFFKRLTPDCVGQAIKRLIFNKRFPPVMIVVDRLDAGEDDVEQGGEPLCLLFRDARTLDERVGKKDSLAFDVVAEGKVIAKLRRMTERDAWHAYPPCVTDMNVVVTDANDVPIAFAPADPKPFFDPCSAMLRLCRLAAGMRRPCLSWLSCGVCGDGWCRCWGDCLYCCSTYYRDAELTPNVDRAMMNSSKSWWDLCHELEPSELPPNVFSLPLNNTRNDGDDAVERMEMDRESFKSPAFAAMPRVGDDGTVTFVSYAPCNRTCNMECEAREDTSFVPYERQPKRCGYGGQEAANRMAFVPIRAGKRRFIVAST